MIGHRVAGPAAHYGHSVPTTLSPAEVISPAGSTVVWMVTWILKSWVPPCATTSKALPQGQWRFGLSELPTLTRAATPGAGVPRIIRYGRFALERAGDRFIQPSRRV